MLSNLHISFLQHFHDFNDLSNKRPAREAWRLKDPQASCVSTFKATPNTRQTIFLFSRLHLRRQPACMAFSFKCILDKTEAGGGCIASLT